MQKALKTRKRNEIIQMKHKKKLVGSIKDLETSLKEKYEGVSNQKLETVRQWKVEQIKQEIGRITTKDKEARSLEREEELILRRLKLAHMMQ